ncbi:MAG: hypothetical protein V3T14_00840 [Myxococcota bacterium]
MALAGVRVLLGGRPRETPDLIVAPESVELLENRGDSEAIGLLAYELAKVPILGETKTEKRRRIGEALAPLPEGAVAALVSRDLAWEIGAHLFAFLRGESSLDPEVLEDLELYLSRPTVPEGFALLALETFYRTRDRSACLAWARVVHSREVRPIRRGLSVWRRAHCSGRLPPPAISGQALVEIADSGEAGDYSLPIVALAAEGEVSEGNVKGAIELYERGLLSLGTPAVRGPVFLRLGELLDSVGRGSMASRPLFRGLALLEPDLPQATPFRALGLMTLFRLAERRALTSIARSAARRELDTFSAEWRGPLGYLAYRSELSDVPPGKGLFARATKQIKGAKSISTQLRRKTEPTGSSSVRGPSK